MATKNGAATGKKRFELPALDFKFASLTDGTDIPPPLPSPVEEKAPVAPKPAAAVVEKKKEETAPATESKSTANGKLDTPSPATNLTKSISTTGPAGTKRPADESPASPTLSNRPGSIRRLFSRNLLHNAYANGEEGAVNGVERPESRSNGSFSESKKSRRSSGWFSRLRSNEPAGNKRSSVIVPATITEKPRPAGPPPPMIPELTELKSKIDVDDEGSLDSDLFKNIK